MSETLPEKADAALPAAPAQEHPLAILSRAVDAGIEPAAIKELCELAWKQENRNAAREFAEALREFKRKCPPIKKTKEGGVTKAGSVAYYFAPLDRISAVVDPILDSLGLSYSWDSETDGVQITTTCTLRHVNGHRESASFTCPNNEGTGIMSGAQKAASAMSFARRQTLTAILGLTTTDSDMDGYDPTPITPEQAQEVAALLAATNSDEKRFLDYFRVDFVEDLLAVDYDRAVKMLKAKAGK